MLDKININLNKECDIVRRKNRKLLFFGGILIGFSFLKNVNQEIKLYQDLRKIKSIETTFTLETELTVCTINTQNKYELKQETSEDLIIELIEDGVDIIGTQETTRAQTKTINAEIESYDYNIIGDLRWGNGLVGLLFNMANETNSIIAPEELYMQETIGLPWIPKIDEIKEAIQNGSIMRRISTHSVVFQEEIGFIHVYNTHLDYGVESIQKRQMEKLLEWIDENNNKIQLPIIITGDMNATPNSENMLWFVQELEFRNIQKIDIKENTYKGKQKNGEIIESAKQVDYIFASNDFLIKEYKIIENEHSDHNAIAVQLVYSPQFQ